MKTNEGGYRNFHELQRLFSKGPVEVNSYLGSWLREIPKHLRNFEEQRCLLILNMGFSISCNGFGDLFYQLWTLDEFQTVTQFLVELGCEKEKALLEEAFQILAQGNTKITQQEFDQLVLPEEDPTWDRLYEIGDEFDYGANATLATAKHFMSIASDLYNQPFLKVVQEN